MADILDITPINDEMTIFKTAVSPEKLNACIDNILYRLNKLEISNLQSNDKLISMNNVLKLIESFKVVSNQKLSKEEFERNNILCMLEDEIKGMTLEGACK